MQDDRHIFTVAAIHATREGGWAAITGRIEAGDTHAPGSELRVSGVWPSLHIGACYSALLAHAPHPTYGDQYKASQVAPEAPAGRAGIVAYLQTFPAIGAKRAEAIYVAFGDETTEVLSGPEASERLQRELHMHKAVAEALVEQWHARAAERAAHLRLLAAGATPAICARAAQHFGARLLGVLEHAPYALMEVRGIGFLTADRIAQGCGLAPNHPDRLWAALTHVVLDESERGHCFTPSNEAVRRAATLLRQDPEAIAEILDRKRSPRDAVWKDRANRLWVRWLRRDERDVADAIARLREHPSRIAPRCARLEWHRIGKTLDVTLSAEQLAAVQTVVAHPVAILTGGPGTGKSTIVRAVLAALSEAGVEHVALCAPTGKAARRLAETTGHEATTIHRLLQWNDDGPQHHTAQPLPHRMVIVDEASMLDVTLAAHLLRAIPSGTHLLLVGDIDQLPSVGPGRVLADLIDGGIPSVRLSTIYRQAEQSLIMRAAHAIRQGEPPVLANNLDADDCFFFEMRDGEAVAAEVVDLVTRRIPTRFGVQRDAIRVLAPQYNGPCGIDALNTALQSALNPPDPKRRECPWRDGTLREGDRLVWTRNLARHDLINGEEVWVRAIISDTNATRVTIATEDGRTLTLPLHELEALPAYCLSVHKAQGSEYAAAIVVCAAGYAKMLNRPLVYTALTRAKRLGVLIGTRAALHAAVARADEAARRTTLAERVGGKVRREAA